jgi:hypothetical protein
VKDQETKRGQTLIPIEGLDSGPTRAANPGHLFFGELVCSM